MEDYHVLIVTGDTALSLRQLPKDDPTVVSGERRYHFMINEATAKPDFVLVRNKHLRWSRRFDVPRGCTILALTEPSDVTRYPARYVRQFGLVSSTQPRVQGPNVVRTPPLLAWYVGVANPMGRRAERTYTMRYEDLREPPPIKSRLISVVCSNKVITEGHRRRLQMLHQLRADRPGLVDFYGRGFNEVEDKWEALAPYRFTIAMENGSERDYWTEKLADALLARCIPLYCGCPNVRDYFASPMVFETYEELLALVDRLPYADTPAHHELVERDAQAVLGQWNVFSAVARLCDQCGPVPGSVRLRGAVLKGWL